jgi:hypothetical protein
MPADRDDASARRSVVPQAAGRSLGLAAAWTGAGAALLAAVVSIVVVAICWLPASAGSGSAGSAIRAGGLTFLAALHGGITVDGLPSAFVPLGMTILLGAIAWRAGSGLADAADDLGERDAGPLARAALLQTAVFAVVCAILAKLSTLGTSSVSVAAALVAGFVLFAVTGAVAFVRASPLAIDVRELLPEWLGRAARAAVAGVTVYLGAGALLVAGSIVLHHDRVETLSRQVGGGWSGVPILLLGILAAPNAAIAGSAYLAGPGFAVGSGSGVSFGSSVHGTLPAFPVLGAVPSGPATTPVWLLAAATPIVAGLCLAHLAYGAATWALRLRTAAVAALAAVLIGGVLAWQGGGAIGSGRLSAFGASPWQFGLALGAALAVVGLASLGALAVLAWWRGRGEEAPSVLRATLSAVSSVVGGKDADADGGDPLDRVS